jgi:hypothetical protein
MLTARAHHLLRFREYLGSNDRGKGVVGPDPRGLSTRRCGSIKHLNFPYYSSPT